jgi:hypothetical protein
VLSGLEPNTGREKETKHPHPEKDFRVSPTEAALDFFQGDQTGSTARRWMCVEYILLPIGYNPEAEETLATPRSRLTYFIGKAGEC